MIVVLCIPVVFMIINIKMAFGRILLIRLNLMPGVELRFKSINSDKIKIYQPRNPFPYISTSSLFINNSVDLRGDVHVEG